MRYWTKLEENILIKFYEDLSCKEIGKIINRTEKSVVRKSNKIGLRRYISKKEGIKKKCVTCGKDFIDRSSDEHGKYCNKKCSSSYGIHNYSKGSRSRYNNESYLRYERKKRKTDKNYLILSRFRSLLGKTLRIYTEEGKIMLSKKYGINYKKIIEHLKPFPEDLSKYHIDHIRPLCSFKFVKDDGSTDLKEVKKAFAPENHQWLLARDNIKKGKKIEIQSNLL